MARFKGAVVVDTESCKGCELCTQACPQHVLGMSAKVNARGYHFSEMVNADVCVGCSACAYVCPDTCITVYKISI